jgi:photosystem II stability/assembly factor-like uncharacterized protein
MKKYNFLLIAFFVVTFGFSQESIVKNIPFTNIGPNIMSGRVADLAVNPNDPTEFYVAYASGGLWYTNNNGTSFKPVLDNSPTQNVGALAVDWQNNTIWVGTGENNASRSSYAGIGILKSTDKGRTWHNMGLTDSHHIGSILINPKNPNEVVVGAVGHLYTPNDERGIFKTTDGGKTWQKTLFINDITGVIEVMASPKNFNVQYATAWQKDRKAWHFDGSGAGSGIYKSTDAGSTWTKISTAKSGFPVGINTGRIGLAVYDDNTIYAIHDNQAHRKKDKKKTKKEGLAKADFKAMTLEAFLKLDAKKLDKYLKDNRFPKEYTVDKVISMAKNKKIVPADLAKYLENANAALFDTPVIGAEVYLSTDGGKTWHKTHKGFLDGLYYSYGYYFGKIHVDPSNKNQIYVYGVPILSSKDGGKTFKSIDAENMHGDFHALWINPRKSGHLIAGNDGGVNISYDNGKHWTKNNQPPVGQFYSVNVDNETPFNVYGGLQDNGVWKGPSNYKASVRWQSSGKYPYKSIMGGDGMQVEVDTRNQAELVYTGYQFGNYYRVNTKTGKNKYIQPKHKLGEVPLRFNWQTPIKLSTHNQDILYLGSNKLHRSLKNGDDFVAISGDLTQGGRKGNVSYGTLTSISESPFQFGLIYTGSDDGLVYVTKDGGGHWTKISDSFPKNMWVSRVIASQHKKGRVYVTLNNYRNDDFKPYVYKSDDYGKTWQNISNNLPISSVNVIKEDPVDDQILYVGNDSGVLVSFNQGAFWQAFDDGLPKVAVHDLVVQSKTKTLLIGTHGRSIYKAPLTQLEKYNSLKNKAVALFKLQNQHKSSRWGSGWNKWSEVFEPKLTIPYYVSKSESYTLNILTDDDILLNQIILKSDKGFNQTTYKLTIDLKRGKEFLKTHKALKKAKDGKYYLPKGKYKVNLLGESTSFEIK